MHCSLCQELGGQGKDFEEQSFNVLLAHSEIHAAQLNRSGASIGSVEAFSKCFPIVAEKSIKVNVPVKELAQADDDAGKSNKNTGPNKQVIQSQLENDIAQSATIENGAEVQNSTSVASPVVVIGDVDILPNLKKVITITDESKVQELSQPFAAKRCRNEETNTCSFNCQYCWRSLPTAAVLEDHVNFFHSDVARRFIPEISAADVDNAESCGSVKKLKIATSSGPGLVVSYSSKSQHLQRQEGRKLPSVDHPYAIDSFSFVQREMSSLSPEVPNVYWVSKEVTIKTLSCTKKPMSLKSNFKKPVGVCAPSTEMLALLRYLKNEIDRQANDCKMSIWNNWNNSTFKHRATVNEFIWNDKSKETLNTIVGQQIDCIIATGPAIQNRQEALEWFLNRYVVPLWPKGRMNVEELLTESGDALMTYV